MKSALWRSPACHRDCAGRTSGRRSETGNGTPGAYLLYQVCAGASLYSSINSAIRSPIAIDVQLVLARTQSGMMDASAIRSRSTPYTRPS